MTLGKRNQMSEIPEVWVEVLHRAAHATKKDLQEMGAVDS